jgi:NAD-dependent DNA ligase
MNYFSFKYANKIQKTKVISVIWKISKDGYLKPTILVEPITIDGIKITKTTGFNAKYILDNIIGPGSVVEIIRSGDVIPYILSIIKESDSKIPSLPDNNTYKWKWTESKVDIKVLNINNDEVNIKNIYHFFMALNCKRLGEKTIAKIYHSGINSINKILKLRIEDLVKIKTFKQKSAENILESIATTVRLLENSNISTIMYASNKLGHGFGKERIDQLYNYYPDIIDMYNNLTYENLIELLNAIPGWNLKTSIRLIEGLPSFIDFYNTLKDVLNLKMVSEIENINPNNSKKPLAKKIFTFSGFRDSNLENYIREHGGIVKNNITKSTDYLVIPDDTYFNKQSEKIIFARDKNIKIINKDELYNLVKHN